MLTCITSMEINEISITNNILYQISVLFYYFCPRIFFITCSVRKLYGVHSSDCKFIIHLDIFVVKSLTPPPIQNAQGYVNGAVKSPAVFSTEYKGLKANRFKHILELKLHKL